MVKLRLVYGYLIGLKGAYRTVYKSCKAYGKVKQLRRLLYGFANQTLIIRDGVFDNNVILMWISFLTRQEQ